MAYRSVLNSRDRSGAVVAVVVVHVLLLLALLNIAGKMPAVDIQSALKVFDVTQPPPPPIVTPPPKPQPNQSARPKDKEGAAAPKNRKSEATPVNAPPIALPLPVPVAASPTPENGAQSTQGASTPGPGTGAGGSGSGTGSGNGGNGTGGGGDGGVVSPPQLVTPVLRGRDFPNELLDQWPRQTTAFLRLRVDSRGYVGECMVDRGTGVAAIDAKLCNLAHDRLRFRPAVDRDGQAVAGWFGYAQPAPR